MRGARIASLTRATVACAVAAGGAAVADAVALDRSPVPQAAPPGPRSALAAYAATYAPSLDDRGVVGAIGHTPLIELKSLSAATGCRILAKAEHLNPGGSVKDRAAASIVARAEAEGALVPLHRRSVGAVAGTIVEGTGGNTGVGLALVAAARGYGAVFCMPANVSQEKVDLARALGARVVVCPVVPFTDDRHYYHRARALAGEIPGGVWASQFESLANAAAHYAGTGPEVWAQTRGHVDAIALSAGTGGTIGGLATFLRERNPRLAVFLADPPGSSLAAFVASGELRPSPGTTITEGIGIGRLTANFAAAAPVTAAFVVPDQESLDMAAYLLRHEGLFVGPSAALNVCGAVKAARALGPGHTVVTVLCDGGRNYMSTIWSPAWLAGRGLAVSPHLDDLRFVS